MFYDIINYKNTLVCKEFMVEFNFYMRDLVNLLSRGKIDLVYDRMYNIADKIASYEYKKYIAEILIKAKTGLLSNEQQISLLTKAFDYRRDLIERHLNKMLTMLNSERARRNN